MKIEVGNSALHEEGWMTVEQIDSVFVTSQQAGHPIESIFRDGAEGWCAEFPGTQLIRIVLGTPHPVQLVQLQFVEPHVERTQEFVLRWASTLEGPRKEVLRQQWNFSPNGATSESEDIRVNLAGVLLFELAITPDIGKGAALASLQRFRMR